MTVQGLNDGDMIRLVFDSIPSLIFVVDEDVRIHEFNAAAAEFLSVRRSAVLKRRGGEVLHCLYSQDVPEGCGRAPSCRSCVIRDAVSKAFQGNRVVRRRTRLELIRDTDNIELYALITASPFRYKGSPLALLVIEDISIITELHRIIPICSSCKKVRDDNESWLRVEAYFKEYWDVDFSHGMCPECYKIEMDRFKKEMKARQKTSGDS